MEKYKLSLVDSGDSAVSVRFPQEISEKIHREVIFYLERINKAVSDGLLNGITDIVPSYAAILIAFNPLVTDGEEVKTTLEGIILSSSEESKNNSSKRKVIDIPVLYGREYGPDLQSVSAHTGLSEDEIIRLHTEPEYPVYMLGFLAGFPYLGGMNQSLKTPRLSSPRLSVPAGSVGIAEGQTGIYPVESPGGWQIIGRTPVKLYNPEGSSPFLLSPGDYVKFVPIGEDEFNSYISNETSPEKENDLKSSSEEPSFTISFSGPLTTVQDLGRHGYMDKGLSICGAMDPAQLIKLNLMVGNEPDLAGIEATFITPKIEFHKDTILSISGIPFPLYAKEGDILESYTMTRGIRTYFAFHGGIDSPISLGSRSTDMKNKIGGFDRGRKISSGDSITLGDSDLSISELKEALNVVPLSSISIPEYLDSLVQEPVYEIYITRGPQFNDLSPNSLNLLLESQYKVSPSSDRMGIRLDGPSLEFSDGCDGNIITDGLFPGAIQITPSGQPIIMNADAQTSGGYSKPLYIASCSKEKVAQLRPGDSIRFTLIKTQDAVSLWRKHPLSILSK